MVVQHCDKPYIRNCAFLWCCANFRVRRTLRFLQSEHPGRLYRVFGTVCLEYQIVFPIQISQCTVCVFFPFAHIGRPCLASRMERAVIPLHYWRDKQSLSSSFLDPGRNLTVKIMCSKNWSNDLLIFRCGGCLSDCLVLDCFLSMDLFNLCLHVDLTTLYFQSTIPVTLKKKLTANWFTSPILTCARTKNLACKFSVTYCFFPFKRKIIKKTIFEYNLNCSLSFLSQYIYFSNALDVVFPSIIW